MAYFSNTSTQGTITNLNMYTRYRIVLKSFNSAGDSEGSDSVTVTTAEGGKMLGYAGFSYGPVYATRLWYNIVRCDVCGKVAGFVRTYYFSSKQIVSRNAPLTQHCIHQDVCDNCTVQVRP